MKPVSVFRLIAVTAMGFALTTNSNTVDPVLTYKMRQLVPDNPNMGLGLITTAGLIVAIFAQPIVGVFSDRTRSPLGRRLPYMLVGVAGVAACLYLIALSPLVGMVLAGLLLLQLASNTVQGPWQALIPDQVPAAQRGRASGIKGFFDIAAFVVGSLAAGQLLGHTKELGQSAAVLAVTVPIILFLIALAITFFGARERAGGPVAGDSQTVGDALRRTFSVDFGAHPEFRWWFLNRLLVWAAFIALNTFLINFVIDVVGLDHDAAQRYFGVLKLIIGGALAAVAIPSGWLSDRIGRKPLILAACVVAGIGTVLVLMVRELTLLSIAGAIVGLGVGTWISASWALITDIVPAGEAARYMGIANIASAGGSAIARFIGGTLIDPLNRLLGSHSAGYMILFGLAALFFLAGALFILPLGSKPTAAGAVRPQPR